MHIKAIILILSIFSLFSDFAWSQSESAVTSKPLNKDPQHEKGVQLARDGKHQQGLAILQKILDKDPNNYAVQRDFVIIATWAGDCELALKHYAKIQHAPNQESYLLIPVSECLVDHDRRESAIKLLEKGVRQWPKDDELKEKLAELEKDQAFETAPKISATLSNNNSDQGNTEWSFETRYSQQILQDTRAYARLLAIRADDPEFSTGDLTRLGIGVIHHLNYRFTFDVEFSTDVEESGEEGITGTVVYEPHYLWDMGAQYASFSEDLPLRAKAADISAEHTTVFVDFHSKDYRWEWSAGASQHEFSDNNTRKSFNTSGSFAHYLKSELEHRLILAIYRSKNSLDSSQTIYYNPSRDTDITLTHKTSIVYDSRFERHADHFFVYVGNYWQQTYGSNTTYGAGVQQEFDFTDYDYFTWELTYASRVYDGNRESEAGISLTYEHKF